MNSSSRPSVRTDLLSVVIDGERIVYDPVAARVHHLDVLGTALFGLLDGVASLGEIAQDLAAVFDATRVTAEGDLIDYVEQLGSEGLLEPDGAPVPDDRTHPLG